MNRIRYETGLRTDQDAVGGKKSYAWTRVAGWYDKCLHRKKKVRPLPKLLGGRNVVKISISFKLGEIDSLDLLGVLRAL